MRDAANKSLPLLKEVLPVLTIIAQWVQILTVKLQTTVSLIRLACRRIFDALHDLKSKAESQRMLVTNSSVQNLSADMLSAHDSLWNQMTAYIGESYSDFDLFRVAEFLDPRVHKLVSALNYDAIKQTMENLCTMTEISKVYTVQLAHDPTTARVSFIESIRGSRSPATVASPSPFEIDLLSFLSDMENLSQSGVDTLAFWGKNAHRYPILGRIAGRVLCVSACSADAERLFSASGKVVSLLRTNLSPENVNMLTLLNTWLNSSENTTRAKKRAVQFRKFVSINARLDLEVEEGEDEDEPDDAFDDEIDEEENDSDTD